MADVALDMAVHMDGRAGAVGGEVDLYVARQNRSEILAVASIETQQEPARPRRPQQREPRPWFFVVRAFFEHRGFVALNRDPVAEDELTRTFVGDLKIAVLREFGRDVTYEHRLRDLRRLVDREAVVDPRDLGSLAQTRSGQIPERDRRPALALRVYALVMDLSSAETRVLGCLLEKQRTTPDAYPLSLNALRLACNQSTNRDPVVEYDDAVIRDALHRLERRGYTRLASGAGSRTAKYRHLLAEALPMSSDEQAVMCVLMLRGPQTPGELKQRTERMHAFAELADVHATLSRLIERELVARLERRPGHKEERYAQLLQGEDDAPGLAYESTAEAPPRGFAPTGGAPVEIDAARAGEVPVDEELQLEVEQLRERVSQLERDVALLRDAIRHPASEMQP
jgi:uncharacterized protein